MKTFTTLFIILSFVSWLSAQQVSEEMAATVARNFLYEKVCQYAEPVGYSEIGIAESLPWQDGNTTLLHIFNMKPSGFVIVAGNRVLTPVPGYNNTGEYRAGNQPPNVQYWIGHYADQVKFAIDAQLIPSDAVAARWDKYLADDFKNRDIGQVETQVGPLLTCNWNQGWPYNYYCPEASTGGHTWVGCVATAQVQIMYYWRWPDHGRGYCSYIPLTHPEYGVQRADFENTWYGWNRMVDEPKTVNLAIAELSYHSAVNFHMDFDPAGSGPPIDLVDSSSYRFKYVPYVYYFRDSMPLAQYTGLLRQMLDDGCPTYYAGGPPSGGGHSFVCDGYQQDNSLYHFNMGWGGQSNGWYTLDDLQGFNYNQFMTSHIYPDTLNFNYPQYASGAETLVAFEGSFTDGSGPVKDYLDNTHCSWLIDPQTDEDSVQFIRLDVRRFSTSTDDHLVVYDGETKASPVLADLSGDTLPPVLVSSGNRVLVDFNSDAAGTGPGFLLDFLAVEPDYCQGMTVVTDSGCHIQDGSGRFHYHNGTICKWKLEPEGCDSSLTLHFNWFDTEPEHDYLEIYDLDTQELLATYSGQYPEPPPPVTAPSGKMFIIFRTNHTVTAQGWEAWYGDVTGMSDQEVTRNVQIIPNPATETARLAYILDRPATVRAELVNVLGHMVWQSMPEHKLPGSHTQNLHVNELPSGIYLVRLQVGNQTVVKRVVKL